MGVDKSQLKWTETKAKPRDYYFMRHFLAINDFRITLTTACESSGIHLLGFIPDYYGEKSERGVVAKYIRDVICDVKDNRQEVSHTPDGVFALERDSKPALFFLEVDRGTEVVGDASRGVLKSIRFYANYLLNGKYQRYAEDFGITEFKGFRSLYVTTTDIRLANIRLAVEKLDIPSKTKRFSWITTEGELTAQSIFEPIWLSTDPADEKRYQIG